MIFAFLCLEWYFVGLSVCDNELPTLSGLIQKMKSVYYRDLNIFNFVQLFLQHFIWNLFFLTSVHYRVTAKENVNLMKSENNQIYYKIKTKIITKSEDKRLEHKKHQNTLKYRKIIKLEKNGLQKKNWEKKHEKKTCHVFFPKKFKIKILYRY